ncbi:putative galacturonosyltransferase 14 [Hordeum vulgare]|nr:putative galacturonosyltransferase 14 [Hordeum vulgare]
MQAPAQKGKVAGVKCKKAVERATPPMAPPTAPARASPRMPTDGYVLIAYNEFDEMGTSFDMDQASVSDYSYSELDGGVHGHGEEEHGVKEVDKAVFDQEQENNHARSKNYMHLEDQILIKAWEVVSLDATSALTKLPSDISKG